MDHECVKNWIGGTDSRKKCLLTHRYYAFMSVVDRVLLENIQSDRSDIRRN